MYSLLCASCSAAIIMYVHLGMWQALALSLHALQIAPAGCRSRNEISTSNLQSNKIVRGQMNRPTCDHSDIHPHVVKYHYQMYILLHISCQMLPACQC